MKVIVLKQNLTKNINATLITVIGLAAISACSAPLLTATPAPVVPTVRPTQVRPTRYAGPTVTASGPLLDALPSNIAIRFANMPTVLGSLPVTNPRQNYDSPITLFFRNTDGAEYRVEFFFVTTQP